MEEELAPNDSKFQTQITIKPPPTPLAPDFSENLQEQSISFFKCRSRDPRSDTWVISVFVILHILGFIVTMLVNDCWRNSHGECALKSLGRLSFQPLSENPLLGPSASTLDKMGALRRTLLTEHHEKWRLFTFPTLHAGVIHLVINLSSVIFVGIHLEQAFGPLRIGIIYILSALFGALVAALFVQNRPSIGSSGTLCGLLGAMFSELIRNWKLYSDKYVALGSLCFLSTINFGLGFLPFVDNFANIGGFISGSLLGIMLLFSLEHRNEALKGGPFKKSIKLKLKQNLDRPVLRGASLILFVLLVAGCVVAVLKDFDVNKYCIWCRYINCVPTRSWSCKDIASSCETMGSNQELTMTCTANGKFKVFPYTDISQARMNELCGLICS